MSGRFADRWARAMIAAVFLLLGAAGCSSLSTHSINYVGVERFAATNPADVAILREEPARPFVRLGEVVLEASLNPQPSIEKVETTLRRKASALGANAVLLAVDQTQVTGSQVWGPYWAPNITATQSRIIVGIALRYVKE